MVERVIPSAMRKPAPETAKTQETSRVENLDPNLCPICHNMLIGLKANGLDVKVCREHNIVMPVKD